MGAFRLVSWQFSFISVLNCLVLVTSWGAEAPKGPTKPAPRPGTIQSGGPPPPPVNPGSALPSWPFPAAPQAGGGGEGDEPRPPILISVPPPPPPIEINTPRVESRLKKLSPEVDVALVRPPLFRTRFENIYRSMLLSSDRDPKESDGLTEETISLQTSIWESENDALVAKHEYESTLQQAETNRQLFEQQEELYKKKVIPRMDYEQALTKLVRSRHRAEETRQKHLEFLAEITIGKLKLSQKMGSKVPLAETAKAFVTLWEARVNKVKSAEAQAKADYDYRAYVLGLTKKLADAKVSSREDLIRANRDAEEALILYQLAKSLVEKNTANHRIAVEQLKQLETLATREEATPS